MAYKLCGNKLQRSALKEATRNIQILRHLAGNFNIKIDVWEENNGIHSYMSNISNVKHTNIWVILIRFFYLTFMFDRLTIMFIPNAVVSYIWRMERK